MAQITPPRSYHQELTKRVIDFLQTGDPRLFPFVQHMDNIRLAAFKRDLREGLGEVLDSGSARKTSATGRIVSDRRRSILKYEETLADWRSAATRLSLELQIPWSEPDDARSRTIDEFLTVMAWHDDNHLDQLRRALVFFQTPLERAVPVGQLALFRHTAEELLPAAAKTSALSPPRATIPTSIASPPSVVTMSACMAA